MFEDALQRPGTNRKNVGVTHLSLTGTESFAPLWESGQGIDSVALAAGRGKRTNQTHDGKKSIP
jgi:hypothetical protein